MPIPELVGSAEAAKILDIGPTNFSHLFKKMSIAGDESFPEPVQRLQCGPIWTKNSMVKFQKHYESRRRRVRSSTNGDATVVETPAAPVKAAAKPRKAAATKAVAKASTAKAPTKTKTKPKAKKLALVSA